MFFTPGEFLNVVKDKEVPWRILVDKNTNAVKLWNLKILAQTKLCLLLAMSSCTLVAAGF